ncbi:MAG: LptA/OstA family protein [Pseudomonadota bacterium]
MIRAIHLTVLALGLAWFGIIAPAGAQNGQGLNLNDGQGGPIEIVADQALEWQRDARAYVARGNAVASRDGLEVAADILIAYYRDTSAGGSEIYRLDARGNVTLRSADATLVGDEAAYDVRQEVAVIRGQDLILTTATDRITADDSFEFWQTRQLAVARGDAAASRADNTIRSDILMARFAENASGELAMRVVDATGGVVIQTPTELVRGSQGRFDVLTNLATITGDVRLTRGTTQLNGDRVEVNMDTGVSRLFTTNQGDRRVRGVITPGDVGGDE